MSGTPNNAAALYRVQAEPARNIMFTAIVSYTTTIVSGATAVVRVNALVNQELRLTAKPE